MKKILGLDGLRAVAILLVLVDHSVSWFRGGGVGVGVFFVLSGYLITTLLLKEMDSTHALNRELLLGGDAPCACTRPFSPCWW